MSCQDLTSLATKFEEVMGTVQATTAVPESNQQGTTSDSTAFFDGLRATSREYRLLCEEKEKQEESPALQAVAEDRRRFFASKESKEGGKPVTPSLWPYRKHYEKYLKKKLNGKLYGRRYCDVGSAPGGMSAFLCKSLRMTGFAFSLPEEKGGFAMNFKNGACSFFPCDLSEPAAWVSELQAAAGSEMFDFINLGVTLQWQKPPTAAEDDRENDEDQGGGQEGVRLRDNRSTMQQIIRNELLFALQSVADGGTIMVTLPNSDHPNTFLYLSYLLNCTTNKASLTVLPTPKLSRKPVYVLVEDIAPRSDGVKQFVNFC